MLTQEEINCIIALINDYQFDGCAWTIDGVNLNALRKKLKNE